MPAQTGTGRGGGEAGLVAAAAVDPDKMSQLTAMGFSAVHATAALQVGDVSREVGRLHLVSFWGQPSTWMGALIQVRGCAPRPWMYTSTLLRGVPL